MVSSSKDVMGVWGEKDGKERFMSSTHPLKAGSLREKRVSPFPS